MRLKLTIEYDGAPFQGWQRQNREANSQFLGGRSIQSALEDAVEKLTGERLEVLGAGRTDAGVHALGQVAHLDIDKKLSPQRICDALNAHLRPDPIAVLRAEPVSAEFHARFDAVRRVYLYRIAPRRAPLTLDRGKVWREPRKIDPALMHAAAQRLIGNHDFTTFRDTNCQAKSPVKTLDRCDVLVAGEEVQVWCEARSFLHRQVRSMVGTLVEAGLGRLTPDDVAAALAAKDRARCGPVAPADGLYLVRVDY